MVENPYETGRTASTKTRPTRWLIWSGIASLTLAVACIVITIAGMMLAFDSIGSSTTPKPSDLAQSISIAWISSIAAIPLGILGIVLIVTGFVVRQPLLDSGERSSGGRKTDQ